MAEAENEIIEAENEKTRATKYQSPIPLIIKLRNLIFGKTKPDVYTRVTFYLNTTIWVTFMSWSIISYLAIASRNLILNHKGIPVEKIIETRGVALGYHNNEFVSRLITFHGIAIICWAIVFVGLVMLYRKKCNFIYPVLLGTMFYIGMSIFYLGLNYFIEDTTTYDKIALLVLVLSCVIQYFQIKTENRNGSINFFGEDSNPGQEGI
jgi:hypothetical protein